MPGDTRTHLARLSRKRRAKPADLAAVTARQWQAVEAAEAVLLDAAAADDGTLALKAVHALTQAAGAYAKLLEVGEIEARLAEIEAALAGRSPALTPSRPFTSAQA